MTDIPRDQSEFDHHVGTTQYYKAMFGLLLTDGTKDLAERCSAWWLMDIVASIQPKLRRKGATLSVLDMTVNDDGTAEIVVHNGNSPDHPEDGPYEVYHKQSIFWTNFPMPKVKLFISPHMETFVCFLPSEY